MTRKRKEPRRLGYEIIKWIVMRFLPKQRFLWSKEPEEPSVFVCNHAMAYGPIAMVTYFPRPFRIWAVQEMCDRNTAAEYAYRDFWSHKKCRWFYRLLARLTAPLLAYLMAGAQAIPVYHDSRIMTTFRLSRETLEQGRHVVLFAENRNPYSRYHNELCDGFVSLGRYVYRKTGKRLAFHAIYACKPLNTILAGEPVVYNPENPPAEERKRIARYLMESMTALAESLPAHEPVPFATREGDEETFRRETELS